MYTIKIENASGAVTELTHDPSRWQVISVQGLEPVPVNVMTSESAGDGGLLNGAKAEMRNIVITLVPNGDIEKRRLELYSIFPPKKKSTFYFRNKYRDVKIDGVVETCSTDMFTAREQFQISLICPTPYFSAAVPSVSELTNVNKLFEFPFSIENYLPIEISSISDGRLCKVINNGDIECGCIITITPGGYVSHSLVVTNVTTGETFALKSGFELGYNNSSLTIDTRENKCSVVSEYNGVKTNRLNMLEKGSVWFKIPRGMSFFSLSGKGGVQYADMQIEITPLFGGV